MAHMQSLSADSSHGSVRGYVCGFVLSVALTTAAFWLVMRGAFPAQTAMIALSVLAFVQIVVHLAFFSACRHVGWTALERHGARLYGAGRAVPDRRHRVGYAQCQHEHDVPLDGADELYQPLLWGVRSTGLPAALVS